MIKFLYSSVLNNMYKYNNLVKPIILIILTTFIYSQANAHFALSKQQIILKEINNYRISHHLSKLKINRTITREAQIHSNNMANKKIPFSHENFNQRIKYIYSNIKNCHAGAENIAYFPPNVNAKKIVQLWLSSPLHKRNIIGNYNLTGIGIARDKRGWFYYTQTFIKADQ